MLNKENTPNLNGDNRGKRMEKINAIAKIVLMINSILLKNDSFFTVQNYYVIFYQP